MDAHKEMYYKTRKLLSTRRKMDGRSVHDAEAVIEHLEGCRYLRDEDRYVWVML